MKRTTLSAKDAAWLANAMAARRNQFAGWSMEVDPSATPPADPAPKPDPKGGPAGSPENVLADLAKERKARQALETQIAELAPLKEQFTAIAAAFGVKPDDKSSDTDVLKTVQQQLSQMQRENAVLALANTNGITDQADIDLLKQSNLEGDALTAMATRLKPAEAKPGTPKPDSTQGGKGDQPKPESLPGVPRMAQAFEDAINAN